MLIQTPLLLERLNLACGWLADVAQVRDEAAVTPADRRRHLQQIWVGAIRGEYPARSRQWSFFCPVWHTGQAVKALLLAQPHVQRDLVEAARLGGDFILANQITDGDDRGLILAFEDYPDRVNISAILEALDGLFLLTQATGDERYRRAVLDALDWIARKAFIDDTGLLRDAYNPAQQCFAAPADAFLVEGRPMLDDGVFLTAFALTGDSAWRRRAIAVADRLLADEDPPGNWIAYPPCLPHWNRLHPRQAYWWGRPMLRMFELTRDTDYLECFRRCVEWYRRALRADGAVIRATGRDFSAPSFDHAASASACAAIMFHDAVEHTHDSNCIEPLHRALGFCLKMQMTNPDDPNLRGAIIEKVRMPDGTDRSPYLVRDLGTIFFVQAASQYLNSAVTP